MYNSQQPTSSPAPLPFGLPALVEQSLLYLKVDNALTAIYGRLWTTGSNAERQQFLDEFGAATNVYQMWEVVEAWK